MAVYVTPVSPDADVLAAQYASSAAGQFWGDAPARDEQLDDMVATARLETDPAKRMAMYAAIQQRIVDLQPCIFGMHGGPQMGDAALREGLRLLPGAADGGGRPLHALRRQGVAAPGDAALLRRLALLALMLGGLVVITFVVANVAPSDPAALAAGPDATRDMVETVRHEYGLDQPLPVQFVRYVADLLHGNLGRSIQTGDAVRTTCGATSRRRMELVLLSMALSVVVGVPLGVLAAVRRNRPFDHARRGCWRCRAWRCRRSGRRCCCNSCSPCIWAGCPPAASFRSPPRRRRR